jgi:hypothetical protein
MVGTTPINGDEVACFEITDVSTDSAASNIEIRLSCEISVRLALFACETSQQAAFCGLCIEILDGFPGRISGG